MRHDSELAPRSPSAQRSSRILLAPVAALLLLPGCGVASPEPTVAAAATLAAPSQRKPAEAPAAAAAPSEPAASVVAAAPPESEEAPEPVIDTRPRLTSADYVTWIWPKPKASGIFIGYVRVGESVALKSTGRVAGEGCAGGYYEVEPRGYVCNDRTVTLSPSPLFTEEMAAARAKGGPLPYGYAISDGAPMYNRVPTRAEQERFEHRYGPAGAKTPLPKFLSAHEDLAVDAPIEATSPLPGFLAPDSGRPKPLSLLNQTIPRGSMLSYTRTFEAEQRTWLLSAEGTLVPADRVRKFRASSFVGTRVDDKTPLPLAWMRKEPKPKHRKLSSGAFEKTGDAWEVRSFVRLSGERASFEKKDFLETREIDQAGGGPLYLAANDATVTEIEPKVPIGVRPGQKWIIVRITDGTLVAYEGLRPLYATLISPGAGGVPSRGEDHVKASTTPLGVYYVTFKDKAATMSPERGKDRSFWIADVPHTQYFNPPFALHAAYWHERFGEPTSAGCINLSPRDAEAMFEWSDPPVPEGWQGATGAGATKENGPTTAVVVRR